MHWNFGLCPIIPVKMFFLIKSAIIIYLLLIFTTFLIDKLVDKYIDL